jgi:hypothetical protein
MFYTAGTVQRQVVLRVESAGYRVASGGAAPEPPGVFKASGDSSGYVWWTSPEGGWGAGADTREGSTGRVGQQTPRGRIPVATPFGYPSAGRSPALPASVSPNTTDSSELPAQDQRYVAEKPCLVGTSALRLWSVVSPFTTHSPGAGAATSSTCSERASCPTSHKCGAPPSTTR